MSNIFDDIGDIFKGMYESEFGRMIMRATAIAVSMGVGPLVSSQLQAITATVPVAQLSGPQLLMSQNTCSLLAYQMGMAAPGVLAGEDFATAYAKELAWRLNFLIKWFGGETGEKLNNWIVDATKGATKEILEQIKVKVGPAAWGAASNLKDQLAKWTSDKIGLTNRGIRLESQDPIASALRERGRNLQKQAENWNAVVMKSIPDWLSLSGDDLAIAMNYSRVDCALEGRAIATGMQKFFDEWRNYIHAEDFDMETGRRRGQGSKLNDDYISPERRELAAMEEFLRTSVSSSAPGIREALGEGYAAAIKLDPSARMTPAISPSLRGRVEAGIRQVASSGAGGGVSGTAPADLPEATASPAAGSSWLLPITAGIASSGGALALGVPARVAVPGGILFGLATRALLR
jgi:hypothetical protein